MSRFFQHVRESRIIAGVALLAALAGCAERPRAHGASERPAVAGTPPPDNDTGPRALCLAAVPGTRRIDTSLTEQQRRVVRNSSDAEGWLAVGGLWVRKARESADPGFYLNADACAEAVLVRFPGNRLARNLRGLSYLNEHRFRDARDLATAILAAADDDASAWGILSDAELELGEIAHAERAAQRMLDLKPGLAAYGRAAYLRWLRGDAKGARLLGALAIRSGREAKDREPLAWMLVQAAQVFWNEGDYPGALAGFDQALAEVPGYAPALVGRGRVALAERRYADAVAALDAAYRGSPLVETAWLLGDARRLAGDARGAEKAYASVVADGRVHDFRTLSLFLSSHRREPEEALGLARAEALGRPGPYTEDALAWALYRKGELAEARRLSDAIVGLGVQDARLLFHAGAIRLAAGDRSGRGLVEHALSLNPVFDVVEAEEARQLVATQG